MGIFTILGMASTFDCDPYPIAIPIEFCLKGDGLNKCWTNIIFFLNLSKSIDQKAMDV